MVADEVRKLAEHASRAKGEIADLVAAIREEVEATADAMAAGVTQVKGGVHLTDSARRALERILASMRRTHGYVKSISAAAEEVAASASTAVHSIGQVTEVAEGNSAASEEMLASSD